MKAVRKVRTILLLILMVITVLPSFSPFGLQKAEAAAIKINKAKLSLFVGDTYQLKVERSMKSAIWSSSSKAIAEVSPQGEVIVYKKGTAVITVLAGKKRATCNVTVKERTQAQVSAKLEALRETYPQGTPWDNSKLYASNYESNVIGGGCYAFSSEVSDDIFGYAPARKHNDFDKIMIGDTIRIGGYHSVVVLTKSDMSITIAEGNLNSAVNWDREITKEELELEGFQVTTRY